MNVIHTAGCFLPDTYGGTEVYVAELAQHLDHQGISSIVAAPRPGEVEHFYHHGNIEVYRYPTPANPSTSEWREIVPHENFDRFATWLKHQSAEVYHQHSYRFDCGFHHLQLAKKLGMKTVVTVHIPEPVCLRQTMMYNGTEACNGKIDEAQCGVCLGMSDKVPVTIAQTLGKLPLSIGQAAKRRLHKASSPRIRQLGTTIATPALVANQRRKIQQMAELADRLIMVCEWMYEVFVRNGVPKEKLVLCKQASPVPAQFHLKRPRPTNAPLRIGFLGRWHETKGIHILVEAIQRLPKDIPVTLIIHGSLHGKFHSGGEILARVKTLAEQDPRIQIKDLLKRDEIADAIAQFDLLAVPSQWMETGPLVAKEAHAVKTPVLGSHLGGIPELVQHGVDGWLVPARDVDAWRDAIAHLATHPEIVDRLQQNIRSIRTFAEVATEMKTVYEALLK
ncbi:glycosyltransferase [Leptolyngbya sp. AN03gr2]|uniref:glycosyltransferase n=1 Tax=unclassified Leptolyngbya TaxID=2650499 RepID=UPI003D31D2D6